MRERVALVFLTLSVAATLGLGGALAYEFAHQGRTAAVQSAAPAVQPATGAVKGTAHTSSKSTAGSPVAISGQAARKSPGSSSSSGSTKGTRSHSSSHSAGHASSKPSSGPVVQHHGVITVGGIYDETGPIDATVERDTVRSYFNLVNSQGGVNGYKLRLLDCDSKYDPSSAHQCAQKLISEGVLAIVGWLSLSGEQTEAKYLTSQGVPIIGGLGVPAEYESPLSFPTTPSLVTAGTALGTQGRPARPQEARRHLPQRQLHPAGRDVVPGRDEEVRHHAGRRRAGRRDEGRLHRHRPQVPGEAARSRWPPSSTRSRTPACSRRWSGRTGTRRSSAADWTRRRRTGSTPPAADRAARSTAPTPRLRCSSSLDHMSTPAIRQYLGAVHTYYPEPVPRARRLHHVPVARGRGVRAGGQEHRQRRRSRARASSRPSTASGTSATGGITKPITYGTGNHDPLHCLQWLHNSSGQLEDDVQLELLR